PLAYLRAQAGPSNVAYYPQRGQRESHLHYQRRERTIVYVRGGAGKQEYFVFLDRIKHARPAWPAWTSPLSASPTNPANHGHFVAHGPSAVRAERPNADLWIDFLTPSRVTMEQQGIPSQPSVSYVMDHNARMMRAMAGSYTATDATPVTVPPSAWK